MGDPIYARGAVGSGDGQLMVNKTLVGDFMEFNLTEDVDIQKTTPKGQNYADKAPGTIDGKADCKMNFNPLDAGQAVLMTARKNRTKLQDVQFIFDDRRGYYSPDIVADPNAGMFIKSLKVTSPNTGVVTADMAVEFSGAWDFFTP